MKRLLAVLHARNMEFFRDYSALGWNLAFPFLLVIAFTVLFSGNKDDVFKVGVVGDMREQPILAFFEIEHIEFVTFEKPEQAIDKVKYHQIDMLLEVGEPLKYWINPRSAKGYFLERLLLSSRPRPPPSAMQKQIVEGDQIRYIDWALPGILAMNMMFSCLFGIGYVIVRYRKNGVLKRLKATPLSAMEFLVAQVISRLLIIVLITVVVYVGCELTIGFRMLGSYWSLLLIFILGSLCMISLGLITATRTTSEEFAGGILNVMSWPMMILSGVWFSMEGTHPFLQWLAKLLPLTHIVDATRSIMLEGAGLADLGPQILTLSLMTAVFLLLGAFIFKWE